MDESPLLGNLLNVMRELRALYDSTAQSHGLTFSRARVLSALARMEGVTQAELAVHLGIEPPTLKRQIDALEQDGFLERRHVETDARKRTLHLTARAKEARTTRFIEKLREPLLEGITSEEEIIVKRVLERIAENAAALHHPSP